MTELSKDASSLVNGNSAGEFSIHKKRASANFSYLLPLVPLNHGPALYLALNYDSSIEGPGYLPWGWSLQGTDTIEKAKGGMFFLSDELVYPQEVEQDLISLYDMNGIKTTYKREKNAPIERYNPICVEDVYGNRCDFNYDDELKLVRVVPNIKDQKTPTIEFDYEPKSGQLQCIRSVLDGQNCYATEIIRSYQQISKIRSSSLKNGREQETEVPEFEFDVSAKLMTKVKCRKDAEIKIQYKGETGVVSNYCEVSKPFRNLRQTVAFDVCTGKRHAAHNSYYYFDRVTIYSSTLRTGSNWRYGQHGSVAGLLTGEEFGSKQSSDGAIIPQRAQYYKYCSPNSSSSPKISEIATFRKDPQGEKKYSYEKFEYDNQGNLTCSSNGKTATYNEYIEGPAPYHTFFLKSVMHCDVTKLNKKSQGKILSAERFEYDFDPYSGALVRQRHQQAIEVGKFLNPVISEYDTAGRLTQQIDQKQSVTVFKYDEYGYLKLQISSSPDKKNNLKNQFWYCPISGALREKKLGNGAHWKYKIDGFGNVLTESRKSISADWDDRCLVLSRKVDWCESAGLYREVIERPAGNETEVAVTIILKDGLGRPFVIVQALDENRWEVELHHYDLRHRMTAKSQSFVIRSSREGLIARLLKQKKGIEWEKSYSDQFGRLSMVRQPDGSKASYQYFERKEGLQIEQVTFFSPNGHQQHVERREYSADGEVRFRKTGDTEQTIQKLDIIGRVVSERSGINNKVDYTYDLMGNCVKEERIQGGITSYVYDQSGSLCTMVKDGEKFYYKRDWQGRVVKFSSDSPNNELSQNTIQYKYDENENITYRINHLADGTIIRSGISPFGEEIFRKVTIDGREFDPVRTEYWPNGQVRRRQFPGGRFIDYEYDVKGVMRKVKRDGEENPLVTSEYLNGNGLTQKLRFQNGVEETWRFNGNGQIKSLIVTGEGQAGQRKTYFSQGFDYLNGSPARISAISNKREARKAETEYFSYDERFGLSSVYTAGSGEKLSQTWGVTQPFAGKIKRSGNGYANRISHVANSTDLKFDKLGNLIKADSETQDGKITSAFRYDEKANLLQVCQSDGSESIFLDTDYECRKTENGDIYYVIKVVGPNGFIAELCCSTDTIGKQAFSSDEKSAGLRFTAQRAEDVFIHLDHQGSSILATGKDGKPLAHLKFLPFGKIDDDKSSGVIFFNPYFAGMRFDHRLNLYFSETRVYCPISLEYLSPDPARGLADQFAYPPDPINFYDEQGLCPWPCSRRSFKENYGRPANLKAGVILTGLNCFLVFLPVHSLIFGFDFPATLRWTIGLSAWFFTVSLLTNLFENFNRTCRGQRNNPETYLCGPNSLIVFKSLISVLVAVTYLGPMLSFIGNDECEPYALLNCSDSFYKMNLVRGLLATSIAAPIANLVNKCVVQSEYRNRALFNQFISSTGSLWFSYLIWQIFDVAQLYFIYDRGPKGVLHFKRAFLTGEIFLGPLMAQPNPVWGLLPALCPANFWNYFFDDRPRSTDGAQIPWFADPQPMVGSSRPSVEMTDVEDPEGGGDEDEGSDGSLEIVAVEPDGEDEDAQATLPYGRDVEPQENDDDV
ncbi:RHS repeat domain-containing protein [Sneathiella glossodoripedis]|uniref:RHS repeat domain-containing protein n=1 Tax=Sneathiella glossodoripedis TaxID=418853 RepID=UPI0004702E5D|nr:hypothetical protein [Sneathiella glossodoripedis]